MKYDFTRCNNLNFRLNDGTTGFIKVSPSYDVYLYSSEDLRWDILRAMPTFKMIACLTVKETAEAYIEKHGLEIIPRDPETYTEWKVGDRVIHKATGYIEGIDKIAAKLGDIVLLLSNDGEVSTTSTTILTERFELILTDYEQEILKAQGKKECPFRKGDRVLVRDEEDDAWIFETFDSYEGGNEYPYDCNKDVYKQCIPYNEKTWKLLGTTDEYKEEE